MADKKIARQQLFGRWHTIPTCAKDLARIGYGAKALIYLLIGGIAFYEAVWRRGAHSSPTQAMHLLRREPLGTVALALLAAGMLCYGVHRCIEAVLGPVRTSSRILETLHRLGRACGALSYLGFAVLAVGFIVRDHSGASNTPIVAGRVMHHPFGNSFIIAVGAALTCVGVKYFYDALSGRYRRSYDLGRRSRAVVLTVEIGAIYGICARGLFFVLCGGLTIYAGLSSDPSGANGMQGVLSLVRKLPFGRWLYGVIAVGFVCYGLFCTVRSVYGSYPSDAGV